MRFASAASLAKLSRRVRADFSLDEATAARLSLGLGGEGMPGVSLFAMPMVDLNGGSPKVCACTCFGRVHADCMCIDVAERRADAICCRLRRSAC